MSINPLKVVIKLALVAGLVGTAVPCHGASISGIVLYSAYESGDPNGASSYDGNQQAQLWSTAPGGDWSGLGVWNGLPPQSLVAPPLNSPDFMVEIPLTQGEYDLTLLGEPEPSTDTDEDIRFVINLYFDGVLDHPGLSVIFPRQTLPAGSPVSPNQSDKIYSLDLQQTRALPNAIYDNGVITVSVLAASFLPPETFGADVDLVSAHRLGPSGEGDFIGVLKLQVEPSSNQSTSGGSCQVRPHAGNRSLGFASWSAAALCLVIRRWRSTGAAQRAQPSAKPK